MLIRSQKYDWFSVEGRVTSRRIVGKAGDYFGGPLRHISTYSHRCSTELITGGKRDVLPLGHETQHSGPSHRFGNSGHGSNLCNFLDVSAAVSRILGARSPLGNHYGEILVAAVAVSRILDVACQQREDFGWSEQHTLSLLRYGHSCCVNVAQA